MNALSWIFNHAEAVGKLMSWSLRSCEFYFKTVPLCGIKYQETYAFLPVESSRMELISLDEDVPE